MSRGDFRSGSRIGYGRVGRRARKAGRVGPDDESERAHDHEESSVPPLDPPQTRRERARAEQALTARSAPLGTTALTVGEAVEGLDLRGGQTLLSASRSASLGRDVLRVSTQKTIHLVVDGQVIDGVSSAATVREALREIGLVLDEGDPVS